MVKGFWGKKIGMTQVFANDKVVPVTVLDVSRWVVTGKKTQVRDGYSALQYGFLRDKYADQTFDLAWLKQAKKYFGFIKEVAVSDDSVVDGAELGSSMDIQTVIAEGDRVDVRGTTKGCGFAGVMRRHNFTGGVSSHGSKLGKKPGSMGFMRSQGRVIKGKRLPGHMGNKAHMVLGLNVVNVKADDKIVLIKGCVPGKSGSLVFVRKVNA